MECREIFCDDCLPSRRQFCFPCWLLSTHGHPEEHLYLHHMDTCDISERFQEQWLHYHNPKQVTLGGETCAEFERVYARARRELNPRAHAQQVLNPLDNSQIKSHENESSRNQGIDLDAELAFNIQYRRVIRYESGVSNSEPEQNSSSSTSRPTQLYSGMDEGEVP